MDFSGRRILMLQGPQSRFFREVSRELTALGARVIKVNLCGGDVFLWGRSPKGVKSLCYHGRACSWPEFVQQLYQKYDITDLMLYGDWRPLHQDALLIARDQGIKIWVFEEGYLRGSFSTLERDGVNGRTSLPHTIEEIEAKAAALPPFARGRAYEDSIVDKVRFAILHHVGNVLLFPLFIFYRTHRPHNIMVELIGILPRYLMRHRRRLRSAKTVQMVLSRKSPFYFYPLQLSSDSQIQLYSPYIRQEEAITTVIASFAKFAPQDSILLIKDHPLDNGLAPYASFISSMAAALGCSDRVFFTADGNVRALIAKSRGVVLINSTVGLTAILRGKPVFCLGFAIYSLKGLASWSGVQRLDDFWARPQKPDPRAIEAFCRVLKAEALIPGNFYSPDGLSDAIPGTIARMAAGGTMAAGAGEAASYSATASASDSAAAADTAAGAAGEAETVAKSEAAETAAVAAAAGAGAGSGFGSGVDAGAGASSSAQAEAEAGQTASATAWPAAAAAPGAVGDSRSAGCSRKMTGSKTASRPRRSTGSSDGDSTLRLQQGSASSTGRSDVVQRRKSAFTAAAAVTIAATAAPAADKAGSAGAEKSGRTGAKTVKAVKAAQAAETAHTAAATVAAVAAAAAEPASAAAAAGDIHLHHHSSAREVIC